MVLLRTYRKNIIKFKKKIKKSSTNNTNIIKYSFTEIFIKVMGCILIILFFLSLLPDPIKLAFYKYYIDSESSAIITKEHSDYEIARDHVDHIASKSSPNVTINNIVESTDSNSNSWKKFILPTLYFIVGGSIIVCGVILCSNGDIAPMLGELNTNIINALNGVVKTLTLDSSRNLQSSIDALNQLSENSQVRHKDVMRLLGVIISILNKKGSGKTDDPMPDLEDAWKNEEEDEE